MGDVSRFSSLGRRVQCCVFCFELQVGMLYERPLRKNDSRGAVTVFVGVHAPNVLAHVVRRVVQRLLPVHLWH